MTAININEYVLVKDKDGQMKYYKDGQFYTVSEIEAELKKTEQKQQKAREKVVLKPVQTFKSRKQIPTAKQSRILGSAGTIKQSNNQIKKNLEPKKVAPEPIKITPKVESALDRLKKTWVQEQPLNHSPSQSSVSSSGQANAQIKRQAPQPKTEIKPKAKPVVKVPKHEVDLEEIKLDESMSSSRSADQKAIEEKVKHLIDKLKIKFSDPDIERRFVNVLTTYFRGVRSVKEIEYILTLPKISGGLELTPDKAKMILPILEHLKDDLHKKRSDVSQKPRAVQPVVDMKHRLQPAPPTVYKQPAQPQKQPKAVKQMAQPPVSRPVAQKPVAKPRMHDVQGGSRLVGPVEELSSFDLQNFRRLGRDEAEIKEELLEKFVLLADQGLPKKVAGIKAWRQSPVFKMYVDLNMRGIMDKKTITQLIEEKQVANIDCLTLSEYEMINELNRELKY